MLFEKTYEDFLRLNKIKNEIKEVEESISDISAVLGKETAGQIVYPIIIGTGLSRASVVSIGSFPPYSFTQRIIYPIGYKVKKRFKAHSNYKKSLNNKVLYLCSIEKDGITVTADDGYVWSGSSLWETLRRDLKITNEFSSLEDFMSLTHPTVIKLIENIGDVSSLEGYIPYSQKD